MTSRLHRRDHVLVDDARAARDQRRRDDDVHGWARSADTSSVVRPGTRPFPWHNRRRTTVRSSPVRSGRRNRRPSTRTWSATSCQASKAKTDRARAVRRADGRQPRDTGTDDEHLRGRHLPGRRNLPVNRPLYSLAASITARGPAIFAIGDRTSSACAREMRARRPWPSPSRRGRSGPDEIADPAPAPSETSPAGPAAACPALPGSVR